MNSGNKYQFPEERKPQGSKEFDFLTPMYVDERRELRPGTLVCRVKTHPWFIVIWEPLTTKVPNPQLARPHCCYARSVIFYVRPWMSRPFIHLYNISKHRRPSGWSYSGPNTVLQEWAHVQHTLTFDDRIEFEGEEFNVASGYVVWKNKKWWFCSSARRVNNS